MQSLLEEKRGRTTTTQETAERKKGRYQTWGVDSGTIMKGLDEVDFGVILDRDSVILFYVHLLCCLEREIQARVESIEEGTSTSTIKKGISKIL